MDFGYQALLFYSLYSDFIQKYGTYYVEEGTESGFIGTVSELIEQYLSSVLDKMNQMIMGTDDD